MSAKRKRTTGEHWPPAPRKPPPPPANLTMLQAEIRRLRAENLRLRMALGNSQEAVRAVLEVIRIEREKCR